MLRLQSQVDAVDSWHVYIGKNEGNIDLFQYRNGLGSAVSGESAVTSILEHHRGCIRNPAFIVNNKNDLIHLVPFPCEHCHRGLAHLSSRDFLNPQRMRLPHPLRISEGARRGSQPLEILT